jgi:hypothetical protein
MKAKSRDPPESEEGVDPDELRRRIVFFVNTADDETATTTKVSVWLNKT